MEKLIEHYDRMDGLNMIFRLCHYQSNNFKFIYYAGISSELDEIKTTNLEAMKTKK